jgi:hypothetical protein
MKPMKFVALACLALASCGDKGLSGTYLPKGGGLVMQKLEFSSGDTVTATMMEQTLRGTYKVDGKQVLITINGQQQVFNIDGDGCLDGGGALGKLCKV